jgi:ribonuclease HII
MASKRTPDLAVERRLWSSGHDVVVGLDEVGRGAWAGPLTIAAVVVPRDRRINGIRDSKQIPESQRDALCDRITSWCERYSVGHVSAAECDSLGMSAAMGLCGRRALDGLGLAADRILLDGPWNFLDDDRVITIVGGDVTSRTIAAASVIAKVTRDRIMRTDARSYPGFEFERNKGYPSPRHRIALAGYGPTAIHRRSWSYMERLPWPNLRIRPDDQLRSGLTARSLNGV